MPAQLVHLAVAFELSEHYQNETTNSPEFYLGSIAPDAIHMRSASTREDKRITHLHLNEPGYVLRVRDYIDEQINKDTTTAPFWYGYAAHLLTDFYWMNHVFIPFKNQVDKRMTREDRNHLYYQECDWNEVRLYETKTWMPVVWDILNTAQSVETPLLSAEEIEHWRTHILNSFDDVSVTVQSQTARQPNHITAVVVDGFILNAAQYVYIRCKNFGWDLSRSVQT